MIDPMKQLLAWAESQRVLYVPVEAVKAEIQRWLTIVERSVEHAEKRVELSEKMVDEIHRRAGVRRDGLAGILGWIDDMRDEVERLRLELAARQPRVRRTDPSTSEAAARVLEGSLGDIHRAVLRVFQLEGEPISARQAERAVSLQAYGFSTVRKRVSELAAAGMLVAVGTETESGRTPATTYQLAP